MACRYGRQTAPLPGKGGRRRVARFAIFGLNYAPEQTGNAPYTTAYAEALAAAGHSVTVVSGYQHYPEWTAQHRQWRWSTSMPNRVRLVRVPHAVPATADARGRLALEATYGLATLPALARAGRVDAALGVIPTLSGGLAARVAALGHRAPTGLLVQDLVSAAAAQGGVPGASERVARAVAAAERRVVRGTHVASVARGFESPLAAMGARSVTFMPNFSHLPPGRGESREDVRARLGIPGDAFVAGYSGNLGYKQDMTTVLTAAARLRGDERIYFVVIGDGSQRDLVKRTFEVGTVRGKHLPLQPPEHVPDVLRAFDLLLATQRPTEVDMSIPSKLTAYFSAGRPVLAAASAHSETAAQVEASRGGVVVAPGDPVALASAIERLRADAPGRARMGVAAEAYARSAFDRERALSRFVDWAEQLARGGLA